MTQVEVTEPKNSVYSSNPIPTLKNNIRATMSIEVSGLILAGGQGRRMNNANKGLKDYGGKSLVAHMITRLNSQVDDIVISANRDLDQYKQHGHSVVTDDGESMGPLSGIVSAVGYCKHDFVFITACDMPNLPDDIVEVLKNACETDAVVASANGKIEPLVCLVRRETTALIPGLLKGQKRSVLAWLEAIPAKIVDLNGLKDDAFFNINTEAELSRGDS